MKNLSGAILICALVACAGPRALAWHDAGHMLTAQIAYLRLTPEAKARVDSLLITPEGKRPLIHLCAGYYTPQTCEKLYDPITIAAWMDDFRGDSLTSSYDNWHYVDYPFFDGVPENPKVGPEPENALARINWAMNSLREGTGTPKRDAEVLGFLYHLVGDVHQPLHTVARVTAAHPEGDAGGNFFRIQMPPETRVSNLHAFWDAAGGAFNFQGVKRPMDQAERARLLSLAEGIMRDFPADSMPESKNLDPHDWVSESNALARAVVYRNISEGAAPSPAYTQEAQRLSRKRIALAGYRLAGVLNTLFAPAPAKAAAEPSKK